MAGNNLKILFAYPASEAFGLSSLGYMWLYKLASEYEGTDAAQVFTDNYNNIGTKQDAIAFSLSFDFDFIGVFEILDKLKIPFFSKSRNDSYPLIFAGGPVITSNPLPYADIFDFMVIGDGETLTLEILDILKKELPKAETLKELSKLKGVYIKGTEAEKRTENLTNIIYSPVISEKSYFKNTFIIEIARGCMNRCAFCTASYTNLPFRNYEYGKLIETIEYGLKKTNKIALLGAQISAHPRFDEIMQYLRNKIENGADIELGISSLRTDAVNPDMIKTLVLGGQKHSTIAIEAASERLRKFINKNLSEKQISDAVKISRENGLKGLKIYSMIGLPSENEEDIEEFIRLAKKLKEQNKGFGIEFSFSTFVPKPHTPFQWAKREDTKSLEAKQKYLEKSLSKLGIGSKFSSPKWDFWQTVLSRSDSGIARLMEYVYEHGGKLGSYKSGIKELNIDISKQIEGFDFDEVLPWDCIKIYPEKQLLINEYRRLEKYSKP